MVVESCSRTAKRIACVLVLVSAGALVYQVGHQHGYNERVREADATFAQQTLDAARARLILQSDVKAASGAAAGYLSDSLASIRDDAEAR